MFMQGNFKLDTMLVRLTLLLLLPFLVGASRFEHAALHRRHVTQTVTVVVTETASAVTITSTPGAICQPPPSAGLSSALQPAVISPSASGIQIPKDPEPSGSPGNPSDSPFAPLTAVAGHCTIQNSCLYDVHVSTATGSDRPGEWKLISANSTFKEELKSCDNCGTSMKIAKSDDYSKILQFEYALGDGMVYYDLSLLGCLQGPNMKDASACPGHEKGLQATGGEGCRTFTCKAGENCRTQAYFEHEFNYQPGAPVAGCGEKEGVILELCAANRV